MCPTWFHVRIPLPAVASPFAHNVLVARPMREAENNVPRAHGVVCAAENGGRGDVRWAAFLDPSTKAGKISQMALTKYDHLTDNII
jgi:hypothetical protein